MRDATETTILVTGATDGLGKRVAQELAAQGNTVLLHGRSSERLEATREEVASLTASGKPGSYLAEVNRHIAASAADNGIPYVEARLGEDSMSPDGVHPNDEGYRMIAVRLRELGYEPLGPR